MKEDLDYGKDYKLRARYYIKLCKIKTSDAHPPFRFTRPLPEELGDGKHYEPGQQGKEASIKISLERRGEGRE